MLTYFLSGSNAYTIRTAVTSSNQFTMSLQDMMSQINTTASLSNITYNGYESLLAFTASINTNVIANEYRATLYNSGSSTPIWNGTFQVYASQSIDKANYVTQNDGYVSNVSTNEFIIY